MYDPSIGASVAIRSDGVNPPYLIVASGQLAAVRALLDAYRVAHWVDQAAVQLDGGAVASVVSLADGTHVEHVQRILDGTE